MEQSPIALIYGTDTNNTEEIGKKIVTQFEDLGVSVEMFNIKDTDPSIMEQYDMLILGIPTWDFGGIQADWEDLGDNLGSLNLANKTIALYGLGDQFGYGDYFVDAMGWLYEKLKPTGATFIGEWSTEGYEFEASRACINGKETFIGLAVDEDQQFELTDERVEQWVIQLYAERSVEAA
ncbi:flavodoxin [Marinomonas mediterranea]|jgi:flavodoxin, long chain|uniref:Flavodoxin n=1 Tax=Marinomonas mediterranea (strain ATCC 700492 / JCM 21426 / NBRC 103028 / MMB-1) TaxID=717774 RepID=F2JXA9_MARM1|nr:flavodoxin [Marinomonas mediterranea]ADZ90715.1 flavodoxin [Marinomonas mediterranea MMB-1]WCN08762.1 flavodoxin [Marinomonas mediterranea]WCN12807.1 flavodoxin [Marinomonas mediterranea]WCN16876.1 flavodoxin [Marinomonas mediterranea MMB-1]